MQKIVYFLLLFILSFDVWGQEPIKGNNAIIVSGVSFQKVKETLLDAGIFIDQQNAEDGTLITKRKGYCECPNKEFYQLIYFIRVKDSVATIRGQFSAEASLSLFGEGKKDPEDDFTEALYWKSKNSGYNYIFRVMQNFAKSLNGSSINYKTL